MGGCERMLPECEKRFDRLEEQQRKLLTDYVTDMESNRREMKDLRTKMDNTHDSVLNLAKDVEHLTESYKEDKKDRKDNRKWIITTWITTGLSLIAIAINLILNLLK